MTDRQDAVVDMYQEVDRFFLSEDEKVSKDKILKKHTDQFHIIVLDIAKFMQAQEFDSKGYAVQKKKAKEDLSNLIFNLTSGFCSFAIDTDNQPVLKEFELSLSVVNRLNDAEFVNYANRLITSLGEYSKDLEPYHITAEDLVNLTKDTQAYSDLLHVPDEVIKNKAIATSKIKELITNGHNLLDDSIDRDMNYYKDKDEPFYLEYEKRREIHDANTHALSLIGTVEDADSDCDGDCELQHVRATVKFKAGKAWKEMHATTSEKGNYQFKGIPDGKCTVTFELEYYDIVVKEIAVYSDKATKLDVKMTKTIG